MLFPMDRNKPLAHMLRQIAALLEEQGVAFKPAAYRRAAQVIEDLPTDVGDLGDKKALMQLPGVGEAIAEKIIEFRETGRIKALETLLTEQGGLPAELMEIEDLGPKRVRQLQMELGITTAAQLIEAAKAGKLRGLPRFSEIMERKVLENALRVVERNRRFPREDVMDDAQMLLKTIKGVKGVERVEVAGSFRRKKATIGDLDVIVVTKDSKGVAHAIVHLPMVKKVTAHGERKVSFDLESGLRVDVRFVGRDQWGSALLYFTGDKEHNIWLRKRAIDRGWKLNEYGLFEGEKVIASREEKDIYEALGVGYVEPERRMVLR